VVLLKQSNLFLIGAGLLLYAANRPSQQAQQTARALSSQYAEDAMTNIESVYGTSFAEAVEDAAITNTNAADMFDALRSVRTDGTQYASTGIGTKDDYIDVNPSGTIADAQQVISPTGSLTLDGFSTGTGLTVAEMGLDTETKVVKKLVNDFYQAVNDLQEQEAIHGVYVQGQGGIVGMYVGKVSNAREALRTYVEEHPRIASIVPAGIL
jgi:hypothetical protein